MFYLKDKFCLYFLPMSAFTQAHDLFISWSLQFSNLVYDEREKLGLGLSIGKSQSCAFDLWHVICFRTMPIKISVVKDQKSFYVC